MTPETHTLRLHTRPVHYRWSTPDGTIHHGSSVVLARTKAQLRRAFDDFWRVNTHVDPEQDFTRKTAHQTYHHAH